MSNIFDRMVSPSIPANPSNDDSQDPNASAANSTFDQAPDSSPDNSTIRTPVDVRLAVQELLKQGYIEESHRRELFRKVIIHSSAILAVLEPLDLNLQIDTHRGVAFLTVGHELAITDTEQKGWSHPLVRRQRLTLEQSLLVAILRQALVVHEQETGVGQSSARVSIDELLPHFLTYFDDSGSDAKNESRLLQLLDQLKSYGIVSEVDKKQEITIRPLIAHLANPKSLSALLQAFKSQLAGESPDMEEKSEVELEEKSEEESEEES